jgi:hypothetical protein
VPRLQLGWELDVDGLIQQCINTRRSHGPPSTQTMAASEYKRYFQLTAALLLLVLLGGVVIVGKISDYASAHTQALNRIRSK